MKRLFLCHVICAASVLGAAIRFDIPAQPTPDSLMAFAKQADAKVLFSHNELKGSQSPAVAGEFEPLDALGKLLAGTGFAAQAQGDKRFLVARPQVASGTVRGTFIGPDGRPVEGIAVRVQELSQSVLTDHNGDYMLTEVPAGSHTIVATAEGYQPLHVTEVKVRGGREAIIGRQLLRRLSPTDDVTKMEPFVVQADSVTEMDPFEVTGQRAKPFADLNADLPRGINDPQPYYIFNAAQIEVSGAVTVEDFLKMRLTMNASVQSNDQIAAGFGGSANAQFNRINLNAFGGGNNGDNRTLILVNGRRRALQPQLGGSIVTQTDISGIPISAIERIEVLPSSAGAIYGATAIGGVINIILKRNFSGGEIRATYQNTFDVHAPIRRFDFSYGFHLGRRTSVTVNGSLSEADGLRLGERGDYIQRQRMGLNARNPAFFRTSFPELGALPNIVLLTQTIGGNVNPTNTTLTLDDGRVLNSLYTFVPAKTGPNTSAAALANALLANAGQQDLRLAPSYDSTTGVLSKLGWGPPAAESFAVSLRHEFTDRVEAFLDYDWSHTRSNAFSSLPGWLDIPGHAPNNPFRQNIRITSPSLEYAENINDVRNRTAVAGVKVRLPFDWIAQFEGTWSKSVRWGVSNSSISISAPQYLALVMRSDFNPFVDTALHPMPSARDLLSVVLSEGDSNSVSLALRAAGPVWELPAGAPQLAVAVEGQGLKPGAFIVDTINLTGGSTSIGFGRWRETLSAQAELDLPLLSRKQNIPLVHGLNLQFANRYEWVEEPVETGGLTRIGTATTFTRTIANAGRPPVTYTSDHPTIGLRYQPVADLILRASWATAFVPPAATQLLPALSPNANPTNVFDPVLGITYGVQTIGGGNPDLKPQNSESLDLGAIYQPTRGPLQGLRFNLEYKKLLEQDVIITPTAQQTLDFSLAFPGRVTRDPATNRITRINTSSANLNFQEVQTYTAIVGYGKRMNIGQVDAQFAGTYYHSFKRKLSVTLPEQEYAGYVHAGGPAKLKTTGSLSWQRDAWGAGWSASHVSSYYSRGAAGDPTYAGANASTLNSLAVSLQNQGASSIPSQIYHQLWVRYSFPDYRDPGRTFLPWARRLLGGTTVQLIVKNVLNEEPPFDHNYGPYYYSPYGDMRLREYVLSVKKTF